jgi:hypothetical protein
MKPITIFILSLLLACNLMAQRDSSVIQPVALEDTAKPAATPALVKPPYNPRKAIIRSAIIPGWGQAYNKKYWKLPLVYGALGTTTALFFRNLRQYKDAKNAYILATDGDPLNDEQIKQPYYAVKDQPERIKVFRNQVRQNVDYCVLFFLVFWGLNVADAAVDAHLKSFDVSDNLSLQFKPFYHPATGSTGLSLVFNLGQAKGK